MTKECECFDLSWPNLLSFIPWGKQKSGSRRSSNSEAYDEVSLGYLEMISPVYTSSKALFESTNNHSNY